MLNNKKVISSVTNKDISGSSISYSPFFSNIGIVTGDEFSGIESLCFHYNRATRSVWSPFAEFGRELKKTACNPCVMTFENGESSAELSFFDTDSFVMQATDVPYISFFCRETESDGEIWNYTDENGFCHVRGYSKNGDARDPDRYVAFHACVRCFTGKAEWNNKKLIITPQNGKIYLAVCFEMLDTDSERLIKKLLNAPGNFLHAKQACTEWAENCLVNLSLPEGTERENEILLNALNGMLYNFKHAPGLTSGYTAYYPNRGGYPCHFLWDTCFQNLALEIINPGLACESLLLIAECQRHDGKYPQFMCSTWHRPLDTQPALVGWAAKRIYNILPDGECKKAFAEKIFFSIAKNNEWWLNDRITRYGLIYCDDGLETGQDNSPRFDGRVVLAVDMNSYLLNQMKVAAFFAFELGFADKADYWNKKAQSLSENMIKHLYSEEDNLFYDALVSNGEKVKIQTSSCFIPLWAGVGIEKEKADNMIKNHLLDESRFFSRIPFPSVAYNEKAYEAGGWWRGPTWPPIAWLMLEILKKYGFKAEYKEAFNRIYNMLLEDGKLHELFNSKTGEGLGNADQGWTQAIFIRMYRDKDNI
ncbi:MAG: hypothetical protein MJ177_02385 [Clostridia bacterium]|nr:hypothetical protein [Clostridia bacterium]